MRPRGPAISHTPRRRTKRTRSRPWRRRLAPIAAPRPEKIGTPSTLPRNARRSLEGFAAPKEAIAPLTGDLALVKEAIDLARKAKTQEATDIRNRIADPAAQKLVEWYILSHPETTATFGRYAAFIAAIRNGRARRCAPAREARLWEQRNDAATVRGFIGDRPTVPRASWRWPACCSRRAIGTARLGWRATHGDRTNCRSAWRPQCSRRSAIFSTAMTTVRAWTGIGAEDLAGAKRAAQRLGDDELAIVKVCAAVRGKADKAKDALDDVAVEARQDLGTPFAASSRCSPETALTMRPA